MMPEDLRAAADAPPTPRRDSGFSPVRERSEARLPVRHGRPRLRSFDYKGPFAYHVTMRTAQARPASADRALGKNFAEALMQSAEEQAFEVDAFCFMPDHVHLLAQGKADHADLKKFISAFKQQTGFRYKRATGLVPWVSYFDRTLRRDEDLKTVADYILMNPVKAALSADVASYELSGGLYFDDALADRAEATVPTSADDTGPPRGKPPGLNSQPRRLS